MTACPECVRLRIEIDRLTDLLGEALDNSVELATENSRLRLRILAFEVGMVAAIEGRQ